MDKFDKRRYARKYFAIPGLTFLVFFSWFFYPVPQNAPYVSAGMNVLNSPKGKPESHGRKSVVRGLPSFTESHGWPTPP
jgi:hypothetical protein